VFSCRGKPTVSHWVLATGDCYPPEGIEFEVSQRNLITVRSANKEQVGQVSAEIRRLRPLNRTREQVSPMPMRPYDARLARQEFKGEQSCPIR
jgi:ribosomal protein L6P/L9E